LIDRIIHAEESLQKIGDAIVKALDKDPLGFCQKFVVPLMPQTIVAQVTSESRNSARLQIFLHKTEPVLLSETKPVDSIDVTDGNNNGSSTG
jgi:hypothetical protein